MHFAGHALPNNEFPGFASLLLAPDEESDSGKIFAYELESLGRASQRRPRLVVLAACSTADGFGYRGEGVMSLVRPFLAAGVPEIVASYWQVDDEASHEFLLRFHQAYRHSGSAVRALRRAQIDSIRAERPISQWAPFVTFSTVDARHHSE